MRTMRNLALAAVAAAALALAGCGGGGSSSSGGPTTPTPPPKTKLSYATDLNASVAKLTPLAGAVTADGSALMMAKKYSDMIGTLASDGNSMAAMMSAQKVLDARTMLMTALTDAKAKKTAAEGQRDGADADTLAVLNAAIKRADTQIEAAQAVLDGDDLAMYVEKVTGTDEDDLKTAADKGKEVAMAVAMALGPASSTNGLGTRLNPDSDNNNAPRILFGAAPADEVKDANKFETDNHQGETWMEITGASMKMRIAEGTNNNDTKEVYVSSVADMALVQTTQTALTADGANENDGIQYAATYKGIPGTVICVGTDCKVEAVENDPDTAADESATQRKFAGSWYFTPTHAKAYYTKGMDGTYSPETYVQFGHWLVVAGNGDVTVNTFAARLDLTTVGLDTDPTGTGSWAGPVPASTDAGMRASSATYSGMAAGRSVHKTLDGDGMVTNIQSGRFTADVMLTATFAAGASTLGGMIDGFVGVGNSYAVDPDWTVKLNSIAVTNGTVAAGVTEATGQKGVWSATSYGTGAFDAAGPTADAPSTVRRPTGIYGGFNAHFTDGHVAGAYATRKD